MINRSDTFQQRAVKHYKWWRQIAVKVLTDHTCGDFQLSLVLNVWGKHNKSNNNKQTKTIIIKRRTTTTSTTHWVEYRNRQFVNNSTQFKSHPIVQTPFKLRSIRNRFTPFIDDLCGVLVKRKWRGGRHEGGGLRHVEDPAQLCSVDGGLISEFNFSWIQLFFINAVNIYNWFWSSFFFLF